MLRDPAGYRRERERKGEPPLREPGRYLHCALGAVDHHHREQLGRADRLLLARVSDRRGGDRAEAQAPGTDSFSRLKNCGSKTNFLSFRALFQKNLNALTARRRQAPLDEIHMTRGENFFSRARA